MFTSTGRLFGAVAAALLLPFTPALIGTAAAAPVIPDNLPFFPEVHENPQVSVTTEDGRPVDGLTVHRGDVLLVHGTGFSPEANRGGFPLPVPPGTPNGVYVLYSGFGDAWKPSGGSPGEARTHPHDRMAWVTPPGTLQAIPKAPIDMHRSIARVAQPMNADGEFTARVVVDPPEETPGENWGVYVYPGAGSENPSEEFFIPIDFSPEPGPNTPPPAQPDLVLDAGLVYRATEAAQGGINPRFGAAKQPGERVSFTRSAAEATDGITRYEGTVTATARFSMVEVSMKDPWIERRGDRSVLTALVSNAYNVGADEMHRVELGTLGEENADGVSPLVLGPATLGNVQVAR